VTGDLKTLAEFLSSSFYQSSIDSGTLTGRDIGRAKVAPLCQILSWGDSKSEWQCETIGAMKGAQKPE